MSILFTLQYVCVEHDKNLTISLGEPNGERTPEWDD